MPEQRGRKSAPSNDPSQRERQPAERQENDYPEDTGTSYSHREKTLVLGHGNDSDPPQTQLRVLTRPAYQSMYAAGTAGDTRQFATFGALPVAPVWTNITTVTRPIYAGRNYLVSFYARGLESSAGGTQDVVFEMWVGGGRIMSTPYTVPAGAGGGGNRTGHVYVQAHYNATVTTMATFLFRGQRLTGGGGVVTVQTDPSYPATLTLMDIGW